MTENNYVVYHLHTEQSLLDSCTNYKDYVDRAVELGQKAIAFTEHGNVFTWVEKKMYCDAKGIKYIHGVECYLTEQLEPKVRDNYHTILLAKNYEGVKEINRLCYIASQPDHFYYRPRLSFDEFLGISDNVIKISACLASPLNEWRKNYAQYSISKFADIALHYDYLEIQAHDFSEQIQFNTFLMDLSSKTGIPLITGTDTHSINQYKAECRTMLQYSKNIDFGDEDTFDLTYKSYDELCAMFEKQGLDEEIYLEAINNTNIMADSVEAFELDTSFKYPILYGEQDEQILLERLREKYKEKIAKGIIDKSHAKEYGDKIKEELQVFHKVGMGGFMLFMSEMISWCWENDIPIGFCRGSVGGSEVAYISDIIDVDPVVWGTMFSRFCNEHRKEIGDIDIDVSPDQRALVYQYIIDRFGVENTAYILANGTLQSKGAIDDICRALRHKWEKEHDIYVKINEDREKYHAQSGGDNKPLSDWWYNQMKYSDKFTEDCPYTLKLADEIKKEFEQDEEATRKKYPEVFYYYDGMLGGVVSQSQHPAGIIASPINLIDNYSGFINADGQVVLPINMEEIHEINLVKYDILGLQNVQIIRDTCRLANIPYPKSNEIDWNDENVWADMITSPVGIFQFESDYAFKCLQDFKPTMINHMSLVNAAIRPSGESYRERLFNHEVNHNPSEQIDELLKDNNGFLVFQEDVIKFLQDICGLSGSDADNVRRAIGRKQMDRLQAALPEILEGYCNKSDKPREIAEEEAKTFLQIIEDSSNYMFGYNHSTGYSMIGYTCAMLRYYYPLEFITAFLNNARTDEDINKGTKFAKEKGFIIKAPKFGHSQNVYVCDKETNTIYKGLDSIKSMQTIAADIMNEIYAQEPKDFIDVLFLCESVKIDGKRINSKSMDILVDIGFFSEYGNINTLKRTRYWYDKFAKRKTIKKDDCEDWLIDIIRPNAGKETEKQFSDIDKPQLLRDIDNILPPQDDNIQLLIKKQIELLGYVDVENHQVDMDEYIVQKVHKDKWGRIWLDLFHLSSNQSFEYKCEAKWYNRLPCIQNDLLKVAFRSKEKVKLVGEDANGKKQWMKSGEFENIVNCYEIIKE